MSDGVKRIHARNSEQPITQNPGGAHWLVWRTDSTTSSRLEFAELPTRKGKVALCAGAAALEAALAQNKGDTTVAVGVIPHQHGLFVGTYTQPEDSPWMNFAPKDSSAQEVIAVIMDVGHWVLDAANPQIALGAQNADGTFTPVPTTVVHDLEQFANLKEVA